MLISLARALRSSTSADLWTVRLASIACMDCAPVLSSCPQDAGVSDQCPLSNMSRTSPPAQVLGGNSFSRCCPPRCGNAHESVPRVMKSCSRSVPFLPAQALLSTPQERIFSGAGSLLGMTLNLEVNSASEISCLLLGFPTCDWSLRSQSLVGFDVHSPETVPCAPSTKICGCMSPLRSALASCSTPHALPSESMLPGSRSIRVPMPDEFGA